MKKSILFGALAFFAISAMGIQNAAAQDVDTQAKKAESKAVVVEKKDAPSATTVKQEPVKEKKADCCAKKTECKKAEAKKADCCANEKVEAKKAGCCTDRKPVEAQKADKPSQKHAKSDRKPEK